MTSAFENTAEIKYHFIVIPREASERRMCCQEYYDISSPVGFLIRSELEYVMLFDVWLYDEYT